MCGIFAVSGNSSDAPQQVLENLKELEYRGYDSWGVGATQDGKITIDKHTGKIGDAKTVLSDSSLAIGHTRWATHGGVTQANAHPHADCAEKIVLVHNGIIENFQQIKDGLKNQHTFKSETDSEVFVHLVEELSESLQFSEAVRQAFLKLEGLSAFVVMNVETQEIVAIKNGSPLVLGVGDGANYVASDANCLLDETKRVIYLEDNQMAVVTKSAVKILDVQSGQEIAPEVTTIDWQTTHASKAEYPHFMLKEIYEQPSVLEHMLLNFDERIQRFAQLIQDHSKIYLVGCGSAYYVAQVSAYFLQLVASKEAIAVAGSEFGSKEPFIDQDSLVIFFSQSGETIDIVQPLKRMKDKGVKTVAVVNVFGSSLYRLADEKIWLEAGPEMCVLSTKAVTAMQATMILVSYQLAGKLAEGKRQLQQVISELKNIVTEEFQSKYVQPVAKYLINQPNIYGIGKSVSFPIMLEMALKIKEVTYIHMEGFASGELKHGVIALIDEGVPCLVLAPQDETYPTVISGATEIKARGGYLIGISSQENKVFDQFIPVADYGVSTCILQVTVAQLISYHMALKLGNDPDKPRNLAKSVTVV